MAARYACFVLLLVATLHAARAQTPLPAPSPTAAAEARAHFVAGETLYRDGNWTEALAEFRAGYTLDPRPEFLINIAQTHRRLGQLDEALRSCEEFLARAPQSPLVGQLEHLMKQLRAERAAARAKAAAADAAHLFAAGDYERALEAYQRAYLENIDEARYLLGLADCYRALDRKADALRFYRLFLHERPHAAERASVEGKMRALEEPKPSPPPPPVVTTSLSPSPSLSSSPLIVAAPLERAAASLPKRALWRRWWLWTSIGGAVAVGVGLGVGLGVHSRSNNNGSFMPTLPTFGPSSESPAAAR